MRVAVQILTISLMALTYNANAGKVDFNHRGVQNGAMIESCYHDPCSVAKVVKFNIIKKKPDSTLLKLNVVGGSRQWDSKKVIWNHNFHDIYITCSIKKPMIKAWDQTDIIPLNENAFSGVMWSSGSMYLQACHNFTGEPTKAVKKYGYNVKEE